MRPAMAARTSSSQAAKPSADGTGPGAALSRALPKAKPVAPMPSNQASRPKS